MPLPFLGRSKKKARQAPQRVRIPPDKLEFEMHTLKLQYQVMSSHGVRTPGTHDVALANAATTRSSELRRLIVPITSS